MDRPTRPAPPESVEEGFPAAVHEEILEGDVGTLEDLREWIDDLVAYKRRLLTDGDLSKVTVTRTTGEAVLANLSEEERANVEIGGLLGSFAWKLVACGNERCECASGRPTDLHGPFLQRHYLDGSGHRTTEYVPRGDRRQGFVTRVAPEPSASELHEALDT
ncbi:hypothetical protein [Halalkalicoccus sp. NIPERK01]|uniref:hypothetical protein n=1 Tax=Halalkalicoccus sp. NIPERK01 TaxID=3053469 RepID=UPI00256F5AF2|nr:hypothetical protein [Halalkalicoccus sp. NIPERK01]MDL5360600.1 hypothetical protein [Halalkalicoccus sp. NIPERK01]